MDISMGIRPEYESLNKNSTTIKIIKEVLQTKPTQLASDQDLTQSRVYQEAYQRKKQPSGNHEAKIMAKFVMSSPVQTITSTTSLEEAKKLIREYHYHHFPVVDHEGLLIGLLSDRDLLRNSPNPDHRLEESQEEPVHEDISDIMSTKLVVAYANTSLAEIGKAMLSEKIKCVPIINEKHQVIGMVTSSDFIRCVIKHHEVDAQG